MILYITNKARTVFLPYEEGLIEWLQEKYPFSQYRIEEYEKQRTNHN